MTPSPVLKITFWVKYKAKMTTESLSVGSRSLKRSSTNSQPRLFKPSASRTASILEKSKPSLTPAPIPDLRNSLKRKYKSQTMSLNSSPTRICSQSSTLLISNLISKILILSCSSVIISLSIGILSPWSWFKKVRINLSKERKDSLLSKLLHNIHRKKRLCLKSCF